VERFGREHLDAYREWRDDETGHVRTSEGKSWNDYLREGIGEYYVVGACKLKRDHAYELGRQIVEAICSHYPSIYDDDPMNADQLASLCRQWIDDYVVRRTTRKAKE
jgi:hypothetical protein